LEANARLVVPRPVSDPFAAMRRNSFSSPRLWNYDFSARKQFPLGERFRLALDANAFNLFNRAHFAAPVAVLTDARFGRITATRPGYSPRQIQLGLRFTF